MNNLKELLELGEPIFKQIDESCSGSDRQLFNRLINSEQPKEWITELVSEATGKPYYHNDIELIEGVCDRLCYDWTYEIKQTIVTPTKSGIAVTVSIKATFNFGWGYFILIKDGIASQYVSSAAYIELASAKCASMAFKNAAKKIGNLFGKSLNRNLENITVEDIFYSSASDYESDFQSKIGACSTIEELSQHKKGLTSAQMPIYMKKLKELTKKI